MKRKPGLDKMARKCRESQGRTKWLENEEKARVGQNGGKRKRKPVLDKMAEKYRKYEEKARGGQNCGKI